MKILLQLLALFAVTGLAQAATLPADWAKWPSLKTPLMEAGGAPVQWLRWHYRSRHPSLIANARLSRLQLSGVLCSVSSGSAVRGNFVAISFAR